jgi:hypothetical protein
MLVSLVRFQSSAPILTSFGRTHVRPHCALAVAFGDCPPALACGRRRLRLTGALTCPPHCALAVAVGDCPPTLLQPHRWRRKGWTATEYPPPEPQSTTKFVFIVDVMPPIESVLGFSNRWYPMAIETAQRDGVAGHNVRMVMPALFVATKLEAFHGRGGHDISPATISRTSSPSWTAVRRSLTIGAVMTRSAPTSRRWAPEREACRGIEFGPSADQSPAPRPAPICNFG